MASKIDILILIINCTPLKNSKINSNKAWYFIAGTIIVLAVSRLLPHPPNFTPLGGIAILGAAYFRSSLWKYIVPLIAFYISDLLVSNIIYSSFYPDQAFVWFSSHMLWNYGAILAIVMISSYLLKNKNFKNILGASLIGAVLFFVISNFGSWIADPMYPKNMAGLITAYIAGLPFFPNSLISTVLYAALGYGIIEYGTAWMGQKQWSIRQ